MAYYRIGHGFFASRSISRLDNGYGSFHYPVSPVEKVSTAGDDALLAEWPAANGIKVFERADAYICAVRQVDDRRRAGRSPRPLPDYLRPSGLLVNWIRNVSAADTVRLPVSITIGMRSSLLRSICNVSQGGVSNARSR